MIATPSPFMECARPAARTLALAALISIAGHGVLLAAAYWLWDAMTPPRTPPMVTVSVVSEGALKAAPRDANAEPAAKPVAKRTRPNDKAQEKIQTQTQPVKPATENPTPQKAATAVPTPDWLETPPVPPRRPAFRARNADPTQTAPMVIRIAPAVSVQRPSSQGKAPSKEASPISKQTVGLSADQSARGASRPAPASGSANPAPRYPWISRQRGEQGRVILTIAVSSKGHPREVRIKRSSGHKRLDEAAMAAVREWRFSPARRAGRAVAGHVDVPITFRLTD